MIVRGAEDPVDYGTFRDFEDSCKTIAEKSKTSTKIHALKV